MNERSEKPFFSIITVTLNPGTQLTDTVISVLNQSFQDFEIIIKDGGSSDNSINSLPSDVRIKTITNPDDGIYDAMNQALKLASGDYILFLNAGDSFISGDVLLKIASLTGEKKPALIYSNYLKGSNKSLIRSPEKLTSSYLMRTMICHQVCYFKKSCFDNFGGFDLRYKVAADYEFLIRIILENKQDSLYYPYPTINYRGGGYSIQNMNQSLEEVKMIRRQYFLPIRLFFFYTWYLLTFPKQRQYVIEKYNLDFYYKISNFIKSGGKSR